ncbi:MAG TPA: ShlB/FhaC/HecB family hemolysin secretion/activation protein, partial [Acetobacteraceae bacterium]|nr:ShlB/FhaC/HecB family hemolysin secretion/activation protein [Acetobacteraceae bacterium]
EQVEEVVYPFLGPGKTVEDVESARNALQSAYTKAGFITVSVERARWVDRSAGIVGIQVIERRVERLRVTHARYFVPDAVRAGAPSVAPGKVPNIHELQADLLGLNQLPDRTVQPSLKPGREPDTVDVDLDVADKLPVHGSLEVNNRYNADTHAERLNASLTYGNFFQRGDSATITYSVAPEDVRDSEVESASYLFHIPDSRLSLLLTYLHSNSNVVALGSTDVAGRGSTAGFRLLVPLGTTSDGKGSSFTHSLSVGWDYKKYYELDTFLANSTATSAPVTYYPLNANYAMNWTRPSSVTDVNVGVEMNIGSLGSNDDTFFNKRAYGSSSFAIGRLTITRQQNLPHDVQLWGSASGQISNQALASSEQFGIGGADTVRGYLEAEALGDYGATFQTELRSPELRKYIGGPVTSWRFHLFGDAGLVNLNDSPLHQQYAYGLGSFGIGTRVNLWGYLNGAVQDAQTVERGPDTKAGTNRVLFRVFGEF